jgi:hypothetical protein
MARTSEGGRLLPGGLDRSTELHGSSVSSFSKPAQGGITANGTFNYFAGDDPTGIVLLAASWKEQARTLKGDLHFSYGSAIEGVGDHLIFRFPTAALFYFDGLRPFFNHAVRCAAVSIWRTFRNSSSRSFPGRNLRACALNLAAASAS